MNRHLGSLSDWLNQVSPLFLTFHNQVKHLGRIPEEGEWDQQRTAAEATINPFCYEHLSYAALSLNERGMDYYGRYTVVLKTVTIEDRSSIFEQNPFYFNRSHHVIAGTAPPAGYRATWADRGRLAITKLHSKLKANDQLDNFVAMLMEQRPSDADCDYIEVHIFGPINRLGIERIIGPQPNEKADKLVWKQILRKAREYGIAVESLP